ncbi:MULTISPECIES: thioredoxin family protein [Niastella]|uniref:Thioredoxin family protein n=1 Tax=Niastella soli TaxID=2821487 RepID=A0ABS3YZM0_9BACT|nr:thioredoxin family protein [Niastella soli]MBO9203274.1 thioredoxin family protein [Niastella soli]
MYLHAQSTSEIKSVSGIQWSNEVSWEAVKAKAKIENKYIFIDCFTTWCGPCKKMDREVFEIDSVGDYMNQHFVCIKLQMDRTKSDYDKIKSWYSDADQIAKQYEVTYYPTFLFFSPEGQIVHRAGSFNPPAEFLAIVNKAMNQKEQYYSLLAEYEKGKVDYNAIPYLIKVAERTNNKGLEQRLRNDYLSYLSTLKEKDLYSSDKIDVIAEALQGTSSIFFKLFYPNGEKVDRVMRQNGFARRITDSVIARQYINPIINVKQINQEPDWQSLSDIIKAHFDASYAERNILWNKVRWYENQGNISQSTKCFVDLVKINGLDTSSLDFSDAWLNYFAYNNIFGGHPFVEAGIDDTEIVDNAINWMKSTVRRSANYSLGWQAMAIDTYAMLLYKRGRKEEAIAWENKALNIVKSLNEQEDVKEFTDKIANMKKNEPTWRSK